MEEFNIEKDSQILKDLVASFDPVYFLAEITELLKYDGYGRIPFIPFISLDSPLRQLAYLACLNLSSDKSKISKSQAPDIEEWKKIVEYSVRVKAGYYDALLIKDGDSVDEFDHLYQTAMPVFFDYHDTGVINYEEQEIERITSLFTPFDDVVEDRFGLKTADFITMYEDIDQLIQNNINEPLKLSREDPEVRSFIDEMKIKDLPPADWNYLGDNPNIKRFIAIFNTRVLQNTLSLNRTEKTDAFLRIFSSERNESKFQFYTEANPVLLKPIFKISAEEFILLSHKQLIHAIYKTLYNALTSSPKSEAFYAVRGKFLQSKIVSLFRKFLKGDGFCYNEYKVDGHGQDILILYGSIAFIIEAKSGKETAVSGIPDIKHLYSQYLKTFKKNIDKAYEQCFRVKEKFIDKQPLVICDKNDKILHTLRTKNYRNAFSIIVTQDRFRKPQINLPELLEVYDDDEIPFSLCIDDLEVIILTMIKKGITPGHFERLLIKREKLQGKLESNDELEIWGELLFNPNLKIPDGENFYYRPDPRWANKFDELYAKGLGFENERRIDQKKSNEWKILMGFNAPGSPLQSGRSQ